MTGRSWTCQRPPGCGSDQTGLDSDHGTPGRTGSCPLRSLGARRRSTPRGGQRPPTRSAGEPRRRRRSPLGPRQRGRRRASATEVGVRIGGHGHLGPRLAFRARQSTTWAKGPPLRRPPLRRGHQESTAVVARCLAGGSAPCPTACPHREQKGSAAGEALSAMQAEVRPRGRRQSHTGTHRTVSGGVS
jgi:hypothetical protein